MQTVCAWCKSELEPKSSEDGITHTICPKCRFHVYASRGMSLHEYLENLPHPVIVIDAASLVCGANNAARKLLQKDYPKFHNLPCGNVFECKNSYLPAGCGNTIYCSACSIRKMVKTTLESGISSTGNVNLTRKLEGSDNTVKLEINITTETDGTVVMMRINQIVAP